MNLSRTSVVLIALSMMAASGSSLATNRGTHATGEQNTANGMINSDNSIDLNRSDTATRGQAGSNNGSGYSGALRGNPGTNANTGTYGMDRNGVRTDREVRNTTDPNIVTDTDARDEYASRQEQDDLNRGFPTWTVLGFGIVALGVIYFARRHRRSSSYT
jgi:hypothetical protein